MGYLVGIELYTTTTYYPLLKESLKARLSAANWHDRLLWVLLGLHTNTKDNMQASPADFVDGTPLSVPAGGLSVRNSLPPANFLHCLRLQVSSC